MVFDNLLNTILRRGGKNAIGAHTILDIEDEP